MKISEQINQIIETRHQHLPEIETRLADLSEIETLLDQLDYVKNQMISPEGNILTNGKYAALLMQNPEVMIRVRFIGRYLRRSFRRVREVRS